nr:ribosomal protein S7 [Actinocyclus sp. mgcode 4]
MILYSVFFKKHIQNQVSNKNYLVFKYLSTVVKHKTLKVKFINLLLKNGNKNKIENLFLKTIKEVQKSTKKQYLNNIKLFILNNYTVLMLKTSKNQRLKKKNKNKTMIPFLLKKKNRILLSLKSIILLSKKKSKNSFFLSLKFELIHSFIELKTKSNFNEELYKLIFLKKNFAHYRWFI